MGSLLADLGTAIHRILKTPTVLPRFRDQFRPQERDAVSVARNLNAAFLIAFTGKRLSHPARGYLASMSDSDEWGEIADFYLRALDYIEKELTGPGMDEVAAAASDLVRYLDTCPPMDAPETVEKYWNLFFPEGVGLIDQRKDSVRDLRKRRTVLVKELNPDPVTAPHEQVLFTSNVLLTVPLDKISGVSSLSPDMVKALESVSNEDQVYWYDHPIPIGIETSRNEVVYGLTELERAVQFEIERGNAPVDARVPVLLSISNTHHGLQELAHEYLAAELEKTGGIGHLEVYAAADKDVKELVETVLVQAAWKYLPDHNIEALAEVLGADGEYGCHYSFLKAAAALWQVLLDNRIKATVKFDLDQVFPQEELVSETGSSAFEHLCDPLWGATGIDSAGREVELGMLAGALVNDNDISNGLFVPDVTWPKGLTGPDQWVFASAWPQALSTEAEMMARYGAGDLDGRTSCLQRVHVTGGTTGITVRHLRRYRPFTPSWVGRAEDQAFLLSILFPESGPALRYAHASGLFMRHDKKTFASEAMEAARIGKMVGDYVRILTFTSYARALPWEVEDIKHTVDPFTGCFISRIPVTVAGLRMALTAAEMFGAGTDEGRRDGVELVWTGSARLDQSMNDLLDVKTVRDRLQGEKEGWELYYDILDELEKGLEEGDEFAESMRDKARELVEGWKIECAGRGAQGAGRGA